MYQFQYNRVNGFKYILPQTCDNIDKESISYLFLYPLLNLCDTYMACIVKINLLFTHHIFFCKFRNRSLMSLMSNF